MRRVMPCGLNHTDDSTLLADHKPADRPCDLVAVSRNKDVAGIQEWGDHWCMILNPNKTKVLIVSRSRTMNPPHVDLVLCLVSLIEFVFWGWCSMSLWTPLCYFVAIMLCSANPRVLFSGVRSAADCHLHLLEHKVCCVARLFPNQSFLSLCHRCHVAGLRMLYKIYSNLNHCLFSELPSASTRVWHTLAAVAAHPLEFKLSRCRTSQVSRYFRAIQVCLFNELLCCVWHWNIGQV